MNYAKNVFKRLLRVKLIDLYNIYVITYISETFSQIKAPKSFIIGFDSQWEKNYHIK